VIKRIVTFFSPGGLRKQILKQLQDELGLDKMGMLKFHAIRWLSKSAVLTRIIKNYPALCVMWEREVSDKNLNADHTVLELVHDTETHKFLGSLTSVCDVLYQQAEINKEFQHEVVYFKKLMDTIHYSINELVQTYLDSDFTPGGHFYNEVHDAMVSTRKNVAEVNAHVKARLEKAQQSVNSLPSIEKQVKQQGASSSASAQRADQTSKQMPMKEDGSKRIKCSVLPFKSSTYDIPKRKPSGFAQEPPPTPTRRDGQEWLEMEKIVGEREDLSEYKCRWKGYSARHDTWEGASNIPDLIMDQYTRASMLASRQDMTMRHKSSHVDLDSMYSYKGVDVMMCIGEEQSVIDGIKQYARDVIAGHKERFPDGSGDVLSAFDIFHVDSMPTDRKSWLNCINLILIAFITGNSSLEPLIEGLCAQIHVNLR